MQVAVLATELEEWKANAEHLQEELGSAAATCSEIDAEKVC